MKIEVDPHIVNTVRSVMLHHIGGDNRISYDELTQFIYGKATDNNRRKLRSVIAAINADEHNKIVICSDRENGGVFMNGNTENDLACHLDFIRQDESAALTMLEKVKAMKSKIASLYSHEWREQAGQGRLF